MSTATVILVVEDSPEDLEATLRAFRKAGLEDAVVHCEDGDDALDYLYRRGRWVDADEALRPDLILLDLNLPSTDGREFLQEIKGNEELGSIPVIVLTTSSDERDILSCYQMGANSYIQKPVDLDSFVEAIRQFKHYWLEIATLPKVR